MNKEFENFKNELNFLNQSEEKNRNLKIENFKNQIEHDKKILKESGVIELFQNIRDNQIVSSEGTINNPVYKNSFLKGRYVDHYEETKIKKPAEIVFSDNYSNNYDYSKCLYQKEKDNNVSISLMFNDNPRGYWESGGDCSLVKVAIKNNCLNLVRNSDDNKIFYSYSDEKLIPIKTSELEKTIAWAIKNPICFNY